MHKKIQVFALDGNGNEVIYDSDSKTPHLKIDIDWGVDWGPYSVTFMVSEPKGTRVSISPFRIIKIVKIPKEK